MTLSPQPLPPVPAATATAVRAAFPNGNLYVDLRDEFGALYTDELFADLYPPEGRLVTVAPWRLALVLVMQYMEGLTDRQAADAVRRCIDGKYCLALALTDPGFDFTLLHDFRERLLAHDAAQRLLDTLLAACTARGWITTRGTQRTDSTPVLAAVRTLHRLENVLEAMQHALNRLADAEPDWLRRRAPAEWYERSGARAEQFRLPKEASKRQARAELAGADGFQWLDWRWSADAPRRRRTLPAAEALRRMWLQQFYRRTTPGAAARRWRATDEGPPSALLIQSPYDLEARYSSKRETHWVGYKVHLSETCDPGRPRLITQVVTTAATVQDSSMGPALQQDLVERGLAPGIHLLDGGYVDAELLATGWTERGIDVVGPTFGTYSRQAQAGQGYALRAFAIDWAAPQARCPQGHASVKWTPGRGPAGQAVIRIRFDLATCRACPVRGACTWAARSPRQLTVRPKDQHLAIQAARERQETEEFKAVYAQRAGVESALSQGTRRFDLRQSRHIGLARTHIQQLLVAVAMNVVRGGAWIEEGAQRERRRPPGRFARLAPAGQARRRDRLAGRRCR